MPTAKVTKNVSAAIGGGNVLCSTLISIKTKAWLYSFRSLLRLKRIISGGRTGGQYCRRDLGRPIKQPDRKEKNLYGLHADRLGL